MPRDNLDLHREYEARSQTPVMQCDYNGCDILEGQDYYNIGGDIVCEDCLIDYMKAFKEEAR